MNLLASKGQLRASYMRWALFMVPSCLLLGFFAWQFGSPQNLWFQSLTFPVFFPGIVLFELGWNVFYLVMGLALAMVCAAWGARFRGMGITLFAAQLAVNLIWPTVFFAKYQILGGLIVLVALAVLAAACTYAFYRVRKVAGMLMLPYLSWIVFNIIILGQLLVLNPSSDGVDRTQAVSRIAF